MLFSLCAICSYLILDQNGFYFNSHKVVELKLDYNSQVIDIWLCVFCGLVCLFFFLIVS